MSSNLAIVVADFTTQLTTVLNIAGTTATLARATDDDGVALPAGKYFFTLDGGNSQKEHIVCDLSGTSLTNIKSVSRQGIETTGAARLHRVGAQVTITDFAHLFIINELIGGLQMLDADNPLEYDGTATITGANQLATVAYVLSVVNGGAVSFNQMIEEGIAGETLVAGNLVYFSETDNEWLKTDADTLTTLFNVKLGIAMGAGTNGNAITGGVLTRGSYTTSGLTQGDLCYASNTAGGINSGTAGTVPRVIGIAKDATTLYFDPDFQNTLYDYAVDSVGTDAYAITLSGALSVPFVGMEINFKAGTANTGACTLAVNGGSAIAIVKNVSEALATGDILANQIVKVVYDGTNYQIVSNIQSSVPVVRTLTTVSTDIGSSSTQFDITNPAGTTFRYTWDSTGTDPDLSLANNPIGSLINFQAQNFNSANNGIFVITGAGSNYVEVTNASGVVENDKTIGTGYITKSGAIGWSKPIGLRYITVEVQGGGGGGGGNTTANIFSAGGGGGGYSKKTIDASLLSSTEYYLIGAGGTGGLLTGGAGGTGRTSRFGTYSMATGGLGGGLNGDTAGIGGIGSLGDLNISGSGGQGGGTSVLGGGGGNSFLGGGAPGRGSGSVGNGIAGGVYGGGGSGASSNGNDQNGGVGAQGIIIITEYYA